MTASAHDQRTETSALLASNKKPLPHRVAPSSYARVVEYGEQNLEKIPTTWQFEARLLARYSRSIVATFLLEYSLTVTSIIAVGHLGKVELGAASLAGVTANITGYAVYSGLGQPSLVQPK